MQNSIKNLLHARFLTEESVPGISVTKKVQDEEGRVNKSAQKDIKSKMGDYDKASTGKPKDTIKPPKRELDKKEEDIHNNVELDGGMEDIKYDSEVDQRFKERQEMAIEGNSKMGNETKTGEWNPETGEGNGNTEPVWGASSADFGKKMIAATKNSAEEKNKNSATIRLYGDDFEAAKGPNVGSTRKVAVENTITRLKFKKSFNGLENALKLIPEAYKTDEKKFIMTDGNETYKIRWEGSLTEGSAIVLNGENKKLVNEDIAKIKYLFGYSSSDKVGSSKTVKQIDETTQFKNILSKTKETKEIEKNKLIQEQIAEDLKKTVITENVIPSDNENRLYTTKQLSEQTGISISSINKQIVKLGYMEKKPNGWVITESGKNIGGASRKGEINSYAVWPSTLISKITKNII